MARLLAAADIGSNTAHLLVAMASKKRFRRLVNDSEWLSLGEVVSRHGHIPAEIAAELLTTLAEFVATTRRLGVEETYVFATEAMRRAANHETILETIEGELGLTVDLISPDREAELGLKGVLCDIGREKPLLMAETGGGSLQIIAWDGESMGVDHSLPLGTGVLLVESGVSQPASPDEVEKLETFIGQALAALPRLENFPLVASGGVARGIWRALHPDGERSLQIQELEHLQWSASRLTIPQIAARYGVKARRAETLLPATILYRMLLQHLGQSSMQVSVYGVREGAVVEMMERSP
jgi:exopolyphosphatase / guanosine-5'-triphosphate,3'-diphosphate pyrophosphatase